MKNVIQKILLAATFFTLFSGTIISAASKDGPEYSLTMDVEYATSTVLKNLKIKTPSTSNKTVDTNYKMLLINGNLIPNADIVTKNNRTLVPIRVISENINAKIDWNDKTRKVTISKANANIELIINNKEATINNKKVTLDVAPEIINNYTYLPIRFVSENMNCEVGYKDTKEKGFEEFTNNMYPMFFPTVIVEEKTSDKSNTSNKSLDSLKSKLNSSIDDYKKHLLKVYDKKSVDNYMTSLKSDISALKYESDIGRYYVFESSAGKYLVNKYTDEMYIFKSTMGNRGVDKFDRVYPDIFNGLAG